MNNITLIETATAIISNVASTGLTAFLPILSFKRSFTIYPILPLNSIKVLFSISISALPAFFPVLILV